MAELSVEVVICTYNRCRYLITAVRQLLAQLPVGGRVRLTVVDNNCSDDTAQEVAALQQQWPQLGYQRCFEQGLGHARNHALVRCSAPWIAFFDDDAEPAVDWIEQLLRIIDEQQFDAFGGVYTAWFAEGQQPWFKAEYETNEHFFPEGREGRLRQGYFSGGIAAYRCELLRAAGGFHLLIGMNGKHLGYGEETAAQRQMAIRGARLGYSRQWTMRHLVPARKQRWQWSWQRNFAAGRDFWLIYDKPASARLLRHYLWIECRECWRLTIRSLRAGSDQRWQNYLYEGGCWARLAGLMAGWWRAATAHRRDPRRT